MVVHPTFISGGDSESIEDGRFIEVQGTAEGHAFNDAEFEQMIVLAKLGIETILAGQNEALASAGKWPMARTYRPIE